MGDTKHGGSLREVLRDRGEELLEWFVVGHALLARRSEGASVEDGTKVLRHVLAWVLGAVLDGDGDTDVGRAGQRVLQDEGSANARNREQLERRTYGLLDDDFIKAYREGIIIKCSDGIMRRVFPRIFTYSADYPEK